MRRALRGGLGAVVDNAMNHEETVEDGFGDVLHEAVMQQHGFHRCNAERR